MKRTSFLYILFYCFNIVSSVEIPPSVLFQVENRGIVALSPDGDQIAYFSQNANENNCLYIKKVFSGDKALEIPFSQATDIREVLWQYDNQHLLITADNHVDMNVRLYQIDTSRATIRELIDDPVVYTKIIAYSANYPDLLLVQLFPIKVAEKDYKVPDLQCLNLKTGELGIHTWNPGNIGFWGIDKNLVLRCTLTEDLQNNISINNDKTTILTKKRENPKEFSTSPFIGFTNDGNHVYLYSNYNNDTIRLLKLNIKNGKHEVIAEDPEYDFTNSHLFDHECGEILLAGLFREKFTSQFFDPKIEQDYKVLRKKLNGTIKILSIDKFKKRWLILQEADIEPPSYYIYDCTIDQLELVFQENEEIRKYELCNTEPIHFMARDGKKIFSYLTLPKEKAKGAVIIVHGGPWQREKWQFNPLVQGLANRGYAVLQINYRGSFGFGKKYLQAAFLRMGDNVLNDIIDGKNWLVLKHAIDKKKIGLIGHSFGGYIVLSELAFHPEEFCCAISMAGISDLTWIGKMSGIGANWWHQYFGKEENFLKNISPYYHANKITKPLLIIDGENDQAKYKGDSLLPFLTHNKDVKSIVFSNEGHVITKPSNKAQLFLIIEGFLKRYMLLAR